MENLERTGFGPHADSPADWEQRQVYAHFGLAIYFCQTLETALVNYLVLVRALSSEQPFGEAEVDALFERLFGGTFGRNLSEVRDVIGKDWVLADEMARALRLRNDLVHHWMRDRALDQGTTAKRKAMVEELVAAQAQLQQADTQLHARTGALGKRVGITQEWIDGEVNRMMEAAGRDQPADPDRGS